jgi:orotate phosphoribosyltransferase
MDFVNMLKKNVILDGHFELASGRHSNKYVNKDGIFSDATLFSVTAKKLIDVIEQEGLEFDIITGPAVAGAILAAPISIVLGKDFVYPEKNPVYESMEFRRGYGKKLEGKKVIIVEDIITTGGSVNKTIEAIEENGGDVEKVYCIWNRSGKDDILKVSLTSLISEVVESYKKEDCPLCKEDIPINSKSDF